MPTALHAVVRTIDVFIEYLGKGISWLSTLLVMLVCYNVMMRYAFNSSKIYLTELEWHVFSALFLLGAAYCLQQDRHVRVDVFYTRFSPRIQALVNMLGTLLFLIPFSLIVISTSFQFAHNAFLMDETSPDPGGLPARYLIKFAIVFGFILILLQGISILIKSFWKLISKEPGNN